MHTPFRTFASRLISQITSYPANLLQEVSTSEKRKRVVDDDDEERNPKSSRSTIKKWPGDHTSTKPKNMLQMSSTGVQVGMLQPAAHRPRQTATSPRGSNTPPARRPTTVKRQDYVGPRRNLFKEYQGTQSALPHPTLATPFGSSSSFAELPVSQVSSNVSPSPAGKQLNPLLDPSVTSFPDFVDEITRQARLPKARNESYAENKRLSDELERVKQELAETKEHLQKGPAELQERQQNWHDSEKEEYDKNLEAAEKNLAIERQANENLQDELSIEREARKDLQNEVANERQERETLQNELAIERQARQNLQNELASRQQAMMRLQNELASMQTAAKNEKDNLAAVKKEKKDLNKEHEQEVRLLAAQIDMVQKKNHDLSERLDAECRKTEDNRKSIARYEEQLKKAVQEHAEVRHQTIEQAKHHVLAGLLRIYAEVSGSSSFTVDNIAPSLHVKFFDMIDGGITFRELVNQIHGYYNERPQERAKVFGDENAITVGNTNGQAPYNIATQALGPGINAEPLNQAFQGSVPVLQSPFGLASQVSGPILQQHSQAFVPVSWDSDATSKPASHGQGNVDPPEDMDVQEDKTTQGQAFQTPLSGPSWPKNPSAGASYAQPSGIQIPSQSDVGNEQAFPMVVEIPDQPTLCKYILRPKGCERRAKCKFSHPGDPGCEIRTEVIDVLRTEVLPAKQAVAKAEKVVDAQQDSHQAQQVLDQVQLQYIRAYHAFVVRIVENALHASLKRENRIIFLGMLDFHTRELALQIDRASADLIRRSNLPKNRLSAVAYGLSDWFDSDFQMPDDLKVVVPVLDVVDEIITDKLEASGQDASSNTTTFAASSQGIEQELDEYLGGTVEDKPLHHQSQGPRPSLFPASSDVGNVVAPLPNLEQDLTDIIQTGNRPVRGRGGRSRRPGSRGFRGSRNPPLHHPQTVLHQNPVWTSSGAQVSHRGGHSSHSQPYPVGRVNRGRFERGFAHRQPPSGPRSQ